MTDATLNQASDAAKDASRAISDTADQVKKTVADKASAGRDWANTTANQASDAAKDASRTIADTADQVKKTVTDKASVARDWAEDRAGVARDWALDQGDVLRDTVQTKPFISVGVSAASAFAAGLVLGMLLTRR